MESNRNSEGEEEDIRPLRHPNEPWKDQIVWLRHQMDRLNDELTEVKEDYSKREIEIRSRADKLEERLRAVEKWQYLTHGAAGSVGFFMSFFLWMLDKWIITPYRN